jgi:hypothetical protein
MGLGFLDREWTSLSFFDEVPCILNIGSTQLGLLRCGLGLLQLRRGLSKSFGEISSFLNMGLGFLNKGLDIVPMFLDRRMGNSESFKFKRLIASW